MVLCTVTNTKRKERTDLMEITKIQAKTDVSITTRLAAYIRVSSDSEDQRHSFSAQYRYYSRIAENSTNTMLSEIYADEGITGTCTDKRDEFNRMMSDARKHKFDRVIVKSVTRFARNTKDCLEAVRELKILGISVYFEENNIDTDKTDGEMLVTILGMAAQNESLSLSKNVKWGIRRRMESGIYVCSTAPYGYMRQKSKCIVDPDDAKIVKEIFELYLSGYGRHAISEMLAEKTGIKWNQGKIRYILRNEKYIGDSLFQKTFTPEILPFKSRHNNGELPKYYAEGTQEPIIDKETFRAVQELISRREGARRQKQDYTFTKMIVCGNCGHTFKRKIVNGKTYWVCSNHNMSSNNCPVKAIPETAVQDAYIRLFNKLKCGAEIILAPAIRQLEDLIMKKQAGNGQLLTVRSDMIAVRDRIDQITRLYESGILSAELYNGQKNEAESKINRLRKMMTAAVDTGSLVERTDRLSDLMDTVAGSDIMYDFEESTFEMTVEKITAMSDTELKFRLIGGIEFTERL